MTTTPVGDPSRTGRVPDAGFSAFARRWPRLIQSMPLLVSLAVVAWFFQMQNSLFLSPRNLSNLLVETTPLAMIAIASSVMIIMGEIDLSLGSIAGLTGAIAAVAMDKLGLGWPMACVGALAASTAISVLQGAFSVFFQIRTFIVTLAGFLIWYGVQLWLIRPYSGYIGLADQRFLKLATLTIPVLASLLIVVAIGALSILQTVQRRRAHAGVSSRELALPVGATILAAAVVIYLGSGGLPLIMVLTLALTAMLWVLLTRTPVGRHIYAVGGNAKAAAESGVRVRLVKLVGFGLTGCFAGLAGLALVSYTTGADATSGTGTLLLSGIGAVVVGGVSLMGGRGSIWGVLGGALLLGGIQNGLNLMNIASETVYVLSGLVVVGALMIDALLRRAIR